MAEPYYSDDTVTLLHGDALDVLTGLPDGSADCVVTSPPYAMQRASTYGGIPAAEYTDWTVRVFDALRRVLTPRGSVLWNISPNVSGGQLSDHVLRTRLALREAGWLEHDELAWVKPDALPTGRISWPVRAWESILWYSRTRNPWADASAAGNTITPEQQAKFARRPTPFRGRDARLDWDHLGKGHGKVGEQSRSKNWRSIAVRNVPNDVDHPAPYPHQLAGWLITMFCPPGGTVLDPFSGSASTGLAATRHGRRYVGIDLSAEYHDLALRTRLAQGALIPDGEASMADP